MNQGDKNMLVKRPMQPSIWKSGPRAVVALVLLLMFGASPGTPMAQDTVPTERVRVVAERFSFSPSRIRVEQGSRVEIELSSEDTFHGFRMEEVDLDVVIPSRGKGSVKIIFNARQKGEYVFECSRPCGAGHTMMRGVIIVE